MKGREYLAIVLALVGAAAYVLLSASRNTLGFALDDAWIHQVFARNLATRGEFSFFAGMLSAGSTAPLWTLLLAIGYWLQIDYRFWTMLLGACFTGLSAVLAARLASHLSSRLGIRTGIVPSAVYVLAVLLEWHLAWGAVSGMEIPLFVALSLLLVELAWEGKPGWLQGFVAGLLTLTRPEGLVLAAIVLIVSTATGDENATWNSRRLWNLVTCVGGLFIVLIPYVVFNYAASGTPLPNTFYAKNSEYSELLQASPFIVRWLQLEAVPWIGAQILLLPGLVYLCVRLVRCREWRGLVPIAWIIVLPALYAMRLPVAYQHGRYEIPLVPFLLVYGILGTRLLMDIVRIRVLTRAWGVSLAALYVAFWLIGANAYATDVSIINCEMVQTAQWMSTNAPSDAVVAAHDIGALGYFYNRPIIDLAGLVSPEVVPFMRDQSRLRGYLVQRGVTHAIFFPDWYPALAGDTQFTLIKQQDCPAAREAGGTDMGIYRISSR